MVRCFFFCASDALAQTEHALLRNRLNLPHVESSGDVFTEDSLGRMSSVLQFYKFKILEENGFAREALTALESDELDTLMRATLERNPSAGMCDLQHYASHHSISKRWLPCLTASSFLWSMSRRRPLLPDELLLPHGLTSGSLSAEGIHGVDVPWSPEDGWQQLSAQQKRDLVGNTFHSYIINTLLVCVLANLTRVPEERAAKRPRQVSPPRADVSRLQAMVLFCVVLSCGVRCLPFRGVFMECSVHAVCLLCFAFVLAIVFC